MGLLTIVRVHVNCQIAALLMSLVPGAGLFAFLRWTTGEGVHVLIMLLIFALFVAGQVLSFSIAGGVLDKMAENQKEAEAGPRNKVVVETKKEVLTWR